MAVLKVTSIAGIDVDAEMKAAHTLKAEATQHPVEEGGNITDNVRPLPEEVAIEGVVAAYPLEGLTVDLTPARTAALRLRSIFLQHVPIRIVTQARTYPAMVITELVEVTDASTGGDYVFSLKAQEIRVVATETVAAPVTTLKAAAPKVSKGKKPTEDTPAALKQTAGNLATQLIDMGLAALPAEVE